jgi:single-strand DNA-binding protein
MFTKLFRIGNDPEIKTTPSGKAVCELSLAYDVGYGQNKKTQWIKATLWDKKADALAPYLAKGNQLHAVLDDVHVETWQQNTGKEGHTLPSIKPYLLC